MRWMNSRDNDVVLAFFLRARVATHGYKSDQRARKCTHDYVLECSGAGARWRGSSDLASSPTMRHPSPYGYRLDNRIPMYPKFEQLFCSPFLPEASLTRVPAGYIAFQLPDRRFLSCDNPID